jgi:AraC-like DNA-binding protein
LGLTEGKSRLKYFFDSTIVKNGSTIKLLFLFFVPLTKVIQQTYIPSFPLNEFVDVIWVAKSDSIVIESTHHAPLFTELLFNYGDKFNVEGQNVEEISSESQGQIISGLKTSPFITSATGTYGSVGLILKPHCYGLLLQKFGTKSMSVVSDVLHEYVFFPDEPNFIDAEKYLLELFKNYEFDTDLIKFEQHISSKILQKGAQKDFSLSLTISQKSFIQKFKKHYLLTPSQYAKLKQVHCAIELMKQTPSDNVLNAGLDAGFYDQAHFSKVFKQFCGVTPKQFLKLQFE